MVSSVLQNSYPAICLVDKWRYFRIEKFEFFYFFLKFVHSNKRSSTRLPMTYQVGQNFVVNPMPSLRDLGERGCVTTG